jgi:hypothetical protein
MLHKMFKVRPYSLVEIYQNSGQSSCIHIPPYTPKLERVDFAKYCCIYARIDNNKSYRIFIIKCALDPNN